MPLFTIMVDDLEAEGFKAETSGVEEIHFGLGSDSYRIYLNAKNSKKLRDALAPFIAKAEKLTSQGAPQRRTRLSTASGGGARLPKEQLQAIRAWWREQGNEISDRGRIPASVVAQFDAAH